MTNPSDTFIDMTVSDEAGINSVEELIFKRVSILHWKFGYNFATLCLVENISDVKIPSSSFCYLASG